MARSYDSNETPCTASSSWPRDRKSTRLNSSHTEIYTLSLHDALPISRLRLDLPAKVLHMSIDGTLIRLERDAVHRVEQLAARSEEHTSELQSHRDLHSFPTRRSSDLAAAARSSGEGSSHEHRWHAHTTRTRRRAPRRAAGR